MKAYPVFEYLPFETVIKNRQDEYYEVLEASDKAGKSTQFIEYMLAAINDSKLCILEQDGGQWRFRHQILQDYFARRYDG